MSSRYQNGTYEHDRALADAFRDAIIVERHRAHEKHGKTSMEQAELLHHRRASILTEEAVECSRALNDHEHGDIHLAESLSHRDAGAHGDKLDDELIQTAAMAYTWWANRRGDRLPELVEEPVGWVLTANQLPVVINGARFVGTVDPQTGYVTVDTGLDRVKSGPS